MLLHLPCFTSCCAPATPLPALQTLYNVEGNLAWRVDFKHLEKVG